VHSGLPVRRRKYKHVAGRLIERMGNSGKKIRIKGKENAAYIEKLLLSFANDNKNYEGRVAQSV